MSSFSPVLAAIDLAIAMASRTPKNAIASALPESSRTIVKSQTGRENHGSFLGTLSVSLMFDPPEGSIQYSPTETATKAMRNSGSQTEKRRLIQRMASAIARVARATHSVGV